MAVFELIVKDVQTGETDFTGRYTADDTETAKLVFNDDAVYVAPHNKLLTRYDGVFRLNDYVSTTPLLSLSSAGLTDARAVGKITFGPAPSTLFRAQGSILVNDVDLPTEGSLELYVEIDSIPTENFFIPAGTSPETAAQIIAGAINDEPDFVGVYTASPVANNVIVQAFTPGAAPNGDVIDVQLVKLINPPDAFEWGGVTTDGGDITVSPASPAIATLNVAKTALPTIDWSDVTTGGGTNSVVVPGTLAMATLLIPPPSLGPGTVAELEIIIGGVSYGTTTVYSTTPRSEIATLIANTINAFDGDFTAEDVSNAVVVTSKVASTAFNGILIEVPVSIVTGFGDIPILDKTTTGGTNSTNTPAVSAIGSLTVLGNNPGFMPMTVNVTVGTDMSANITIDPTESVSDIAWAIRSALTTDPTISPVWTVGGSGTQITFTAVTPGTSFNSRVIRLNFIATTSNITPIIGGVPLPSFTVNATYTSSNIAQLIAGTINSNSIVWTATAVGSVVNISSINQSASFNGVTFAGDVTGTQDINITGSTSSGGVTSVETITYATGSLTVLGNNLDVTYTSVVVSVTVGLNESVDITIDPTDTPTDITTAIRNALIADGTFTPTWAVSGSGTQIIFTAVAAGAAGNNKSVTLNFKETTTGVSTTLDTTIVNLAGGIDEGATIPQQIQIKIGNGTPVTVASIVGLESANSIATKALTALNASIEFLNFTFTRTENIIDGVAILGGTLQNRTIGILEDAGTTITTEGFSGGQNVFTQGALDPNTVYWYTARYVYRDGHKTKTAFPVVIKTGNANYEVKLNVDLASDVDGDYCDVEVFRKIGSNEFQRIDRFTPKVFEGNTAVYVDTGRPDIEPLDEQEYVWTTRHETHEMVQDRYVRANVVYSDKTLPELAETNTQDEVFQVTKVAGQTTIGNSLPFNTVFDVYVKGKYTDGSDSFFEKLTDLETDYDSEYLKVQQTKQLDGFKEFSFWAKYTTKPQEGIGFSTVDFANINLPTTFSGKVDNTGTPEPIRPAISPINPRLFLGFNQITRKYVGAGPRYEYHVTLADMYEFTRDESAAVDLTANKRLLTADEPTTDGSANHPDFITISAFGDVGGVGQLRYYRVFEADATATTATYRLLLTPALLKSVYSGEVFLVTQTITRPTSVTALETEVIGSRAKVIDVQITKHPDADVTASYDGGCVYLILESGTALDKIDSNLISLPSIGKGTSHWFGAFSLVDTYSSGSASLVTTPVMFFNLFGLNIEEDLPVAGQYTVHAVNSVTSPALYYLGRKDNEVDVAPVTLQTTGFDYEQETDGIIGTFEYRILEDYNIFATLLTKDDLQELKEDFPYQIIWSEPFILGSSISGLRSFKFSNFLNLSNEYGPVVDVRYHNTKLFIFTERALAVSNIGEVLTSTASGETFVDSSRFLSGAYFLLKNLPSIQPKSIVKYESMLFFSDGKDVWMITESPQNISNGAVELTDTGAVGVVDPVNKEYRISDNGQTWAYNWESQTWVGPYTYADTVGVTANQDMFSVNSNKIVRHNDTNAFDGANFDTVVESVADDLEESSIDKLFRKWYLDYEVEEASFVLTEGGDPVLDEDEQEVDMETSTNDFQYGKVYGEWLSPTSISEKNEVRGIGIKKEAQNAKRLYWKFLSNAADFVIRMVAFEWMPRNRR
jgi:hypothetical protein